MNWLGSRSGAAALLLAATLNAAVAAPVTYSFTTGPLVAVGVFNAGDPAPSADLFTGAGVSGTFVYDSSALLALTNPDGSAVYRGSAPESLTGFVTSLSNLSGSVAAHVFADGSGSTQVGNDTHLTAGQTTRVDIFQFSFEPPLTSGFPRNLTGVDIEGFTLTNIRMFWIEGLSFGGPVTPDFLSGSTLLAAPPAFAGRMVFDFIQTGNPAAMSSVIFDELIVAVPEPETYALLLAGLGLLAFVARRRNRALTPIGYF